MPQSGPQTLAYTSPADELFFGGSAGPGKSWLLLGLAATAHRKSLILRREATQLKELTDSLHDICGGNGKWRMSGHGGLMRDLPGDRQIELAGCEQEKDKEKYKGRARDFTGWDELSDFSETQFEFINIWTRTSIPGQRCRVVGAGNPPTTAEGEWVIRRWAPWLDKQHHNPAAPTELRWYASIDGAVKEVESAKPFEFKGEIIVPQSRTFIPATLDDNPILKETGYGNRLANLPEPLRSLYLKGDFTAGRKDDEWQVIPTAWVIAAQNRWREATKVDSFGKVLQRPDHPLQCVGVDVGRGGVDSTAIAKRYGPWLAPPIKYSGEETNDGPKCAAKVLENLGEGELNAAIHIDVIGIGSSPYDSLKGIKVKRLNVRPINFAESTNAKNRTGVLEYRNVRAEAWWSLREALDPKMGDNLMLPPLPEITADLTAPRWTPTASGIQIESKDEIRKRIGRSPDCFVAGTPILTIDGNQPIEQIGIGMPVWTKDGWRRVVGAGVTDVDSPTYEVLFSDGRTLRGSGNHPVFVTGKGWVHLKNLTKADRVEVCNHETSLFSTASPSFAFQKAKANRRANTTTHSQTTGDLKELAHCIRLFGDQCMDQFQTDMRYITSTRIPSIIPLRIWNALRHRSTRNATATKAKHSAHTLSGYASLRLSGTDLLKGVLGIRSTGERLGLVVEPRIESVRSVSGHSSVRVCENRISFAPTLACNATTTNARKTSLSRHALAARKSFQRQVTEKVDAAPVRVVCVYRAPDAPVCNLTVEGTSEYYANGIRVHNCGDAIAMSMLPVIIVKGWKLESF